jgi:hypothetical protein
MNSEALWTKPVGKRSYESPIEREGLVYNADELRRFFDLPVKADGKTQEPDAIIAICDTKDKGTDYAFLPVAYVYGQDYYIQDCVCDNGLPDIVDVRLTEILVRHIVKQCQFESNSAGGVWLKKFKRMSRIEGHNTNHNEVHYAK